MLSIILEFEVIDGLEEDFKKYWQETTQYIFENFGSLGSRLHQSENGTFIAYAQWPNSIVYEACQKSMPEIEAREKMRKTLKHGTPKILHRLEVVKDMLSPMEYNENYA